MIDKSKWTKVDWSNYSCEKETHIGNNVAFSCIITESGKIQSDDEGIAVYGSINKTCLSNSSSHCLSDSDFSTNEQIYIFAINIIQAFTIYSTAYL